ncbi:serine/threonine-protein kinase [Chelativorans sp. AA-79]|uniref:serine/threonine-protein kinase n=1 Tax=Chelativorans sp. AA-79 TaxID=3028735 RepID=UPI0023F70AD2|nr:serine/threonine-protein kinase [Chelativorans sp. AA-79]WEX10857.1 protein kinase [Chelativorans sp. AA-79]
MSSDDKTQILPGAHVDVGTQLSGIYELDERIAMGGMGEVFRGHNIQTGDPVAIKIVLPEFARDETILSLFKKEASILNHLSHEAIVRYHVFTIDPGMGRPYLAMEFVDGESLIDVMKRGPMPSQDVRRLCLRVASGLAAAHEAGIIHRDLSPDNVILPGGRVERAKIIDFGIARSAIVGGKTLLEGKFAGKYNYVSPEQLGLFGGEVTERSDIYSLGLVLAAVSLGAPLDMSGSQLEVIEKRRVVPDISSMDPTLRPLVEAMLQPDPANRPPGMAEIAAWLSQQDAAATIPPRQNDSAPTVSTAPGTGGTSAEAVVAESPFGPVAPPQTPFTASAAPGSQAGGRPPGPKRFILPSAAVILLAAAGGGAYYLDLFGRSPSMPDAPAQQAETPLLAPNDPEQQASAEPAGSTSPPASESATAAPPTVEQADRQPQETASPAAQPGPEEVQAPSMHAPAPQQAALSSDTAAPSAPATPGTEASPPAELTAVLPGAPRQDAAKVIDDVATRVSWIRDYGDRDCFYATAVSVTDKSAEIEGFGRSVEPFEALLQDFQKTFHIEPEIGARLIEPEQCVITDFLRQVGGSAASAPVLSLGQTLIANGAEVHGEIAKLNGRKIDLILIDHKGMAYSLNKHVRNEGGRAEFSINVGLASADLARNRTVPQVVVAVVSRNGLDAANFSRPIRASEVLPRVLAEISAGGPESTAVAKYFRLGG